MTIQRTCLAFTVSMLLAPVLGRAQETPASQPTLPTPEAELSYALGLEIGTWLKQLGEQIDLDAFSQAVQHSLHNKNPLLTPQQAASIKQAAFARIQKHQAEKRQLLGKKNLAAGQAFLEANKKNEGVITTDSGLQYTVLRQGDGDKPLATDQVTVHYRGTLLDGTEFDSSYQRGSTAKFPLNGVIPGWTEGVQLMKTGALYRFFVPASLAYGERGSQPKIEPNATLIFDVELIAIEK